MILCNQTQNLKTNLSFTYLNGSYLIIVSNSRFCNKYHERLMDNCKIYLEHCGGVLYITK